MCVGSIWWAVRRGWCELLVRWLNRWIAGDTLCRGLGVEIDAELEYYCEEGLEDENTSIQLMRVQLAHTM